MYVTATESSESSAALMPTEDSRPSRVFVVEDSDVVRALWRIVVSNCSDPTHRRYFAKAGAYAFFDKSHELAAMRRMLASLAGFGSPAGLS